MRRGFLKNVNPNFVLQKFVIFFLLIINVRATETTNMSNMEEQFSQKSQDFAIKLYGELRKESSGENIVYSPFSIQTCLAMARMGAGGETAAEMDRGLGLDSLDDVTIANTFNNILTKYQNSSILKIANKIYVMTGHTVQREYNLILTEKFYSAADEINFGKNVAAAKTINLWVESKTNNLIKDILSPDAIGADTRLVLLNAIHFKGEWVHKFPEHATKDDKFYINENDFVQVPMMNVKAKFEYAILPELDATAIEMPYKDSDLSMLVILPNSRTGLKDLEEKLKTVSLTSIKNKMSMRTVIVKFPKFKAEFSATLNEPLRNLGMKKMFGNADFSKMLESGEALQVSAVVHKAFIEVNEEGTEAAAATSCIMRKKRSLSYVPPPESFMVEHPFFYIIHHHLKSTDTHLNDSTVAKSVSLFYGSVKKLNESRGRTAREEL